MVHGAVRSLFQLLGAFVVGLLILIPVLLWRLSNGPINLDFITPYIEEALQTPDGSLAVRLDSTVLVLGDGERRRLEIRALGVHAYTRDSARPVASVPEISVAFNARALLGGHIAPNSITLRRPKLHLVRGADGKLEMDIGVDLGGADLGGSGNNSSSAVAAAILDALMGEPDPSKPGRSLQRAAVVDAELSVTDLALGVEWHAPQVDLELRRIADGLEAKAALELDLGGESGSADATFRYAKADNQISGEVFIAGIRPSALARLGGPLTPLKALDLPLAGRVNFIADSTGRVERVDFDMAGGTGFFDLPAPVDMHRSVDSVGLRGTAFDGLRRAKLDELSIDFGGPKLKLFGDADGLGGAASLRLEAVLTNVPFDELPKLWPAAAAPNPREWVLSNMSKGIAREARLVMSAHSQSGQFDDLALDSLAGELQGDGVQVDYLRPMPAARNAAAHATFDASSFRIELQSGDVFGLKLKQGTVVLSGLNEVDQFADIDLTISGPAKDALTLIDHKPLGYASALGIDPSTVRGEGTTRLQLKFPLLKDLRLDDLAVKVHSSVKNVFLPQVVMGLDLNDAALEIDVDAKGLDAVGPIVLGGISGQLKWRENFSTKNVPFRSRYEVHAPAIDEQGRKQLRLEGPPFVSPFLSGPVAADVTAVLYGGGRGDIDAKVNLGSAKMRLPGLGWRKKPGVLGVADVSVRLEKNQLAAIPKFSVNAGDLQTNGSVAFDDQGRPRKVTFDRIAYGGRTDMSGSLTIRPDGGGLDIVAKGAQFNAEPVIGQEETDPDDPPAVGNPHRQKADLPAMTIQGSAAKAWVSKDGFLADAQADLHRDAKEWRHMDVLGSVGDGKNFTLALRRDGPNRRSVSVRSSDAGAVLKAFDSYRYMEKGTLEVDAAYHDGEDGQPLIGTIKASDYYIVNAPALARLLSVAALTGIVDVLQGEGIGFSTLDAPFTLKDGLLTVKDVRAYGAALGITSTGQVDLDSGRLALEGTVVPMYALNSALGKIPLIGWLITGGEKGGGLVAFNYGMKGSTQDPQVTVNPLSALTPGFLRNFFNIFDDGTETEARKPEAAPKSPAPEAGMPEPQIKP